MSKKLKKLIKKLIKEQSTEDTTYAIAPKDPDRGDPVDPTAGGGGNVDPGKLTPIKTSFDRVSGIKTNGVVLRVVGFYGSVSGEVLPVDLVEYPQQFCNEDFERAAVSIIDKPDEETVPSTLQRDPIQQFDLSQDT